uniref:Uncharacterized protein n=1 Tax=Parastrongyloides trichosuri TaxID=131310 RepID=A0A0N4ZCM1_PARTI
MDKQLSLPFCINTIRLQCEKRMRKTSARRVLILLRKKLKCFENEMKNVGKGEFYIIPRSKYDEIKIKQKLNNTKESEGIFTLKEKTNLWKFFWIADRPTFQFKIKINYPLMEPRILSEYLLKKNLQCQYIVKINKTFIFGSESKVLIEKLENHFLENIENFKIENEDKKIELKVITRKECKDYIESYDPLNRNPKENENDFTFKIMLKRKDNGCIYFQEFKKMFCTDLNLYLENIIMEKNNIIILESKHNQNSFKKISSYLSSFKGVIKTENCREYNIDFIQSNSVYKIKIIIDIYLLDRKDIINGLHQRGIFPQYLKYNALEIIIGSINKEDIELWRINLKYKEKILNIGKNNEVRKISGFKIIEEKHEHPVSHLAWRI